MKRITLPKDGRYFILANHILLIIFGFAFFQFQRSVSQLVLGVAAALITESVLAYWTGKAQTQEAMWDRWFSALIAGLSIFLLISSHAVWFYALGSFIAISSKYALRINKDRHIFNPSGVAIVVLLAILPTHYFRLYGDEFNLNVFLIVQVLFFGILATSASNRWTMALSYMATNLVGSVLMMLVHDRSFLYFIGPELSANGLLFIWLMMTDPRTTPDARKSQAIAGAAIAALNLIFRHEEILYGQFIALVLVCSSRTLFAAFSKPLPKPQLT